MSSPGRTWRRSCRSWTAPPRPEALREELRAVLAQGGYPERTVTAQAPIEALESGYRLRNSYALIDGLYGGLPGIVAGALPAAQETGREEA